MSIFSKNKGEFKEELNQLRTQPGAPMQQFSKENEKELLERAKATELAEAQALLERIQKTRVPTAESEYLSFIGDGGLLQMRPTSVERAQTEGHKPQEVAAQGFEDRGSVFG